MSQFHDEALKLVSDLSDIRLSAAKRTTARFGAEAPPAFREWAALDKGLCATFSNSDMFLFDAPRSTVLDDGRRGLVFHIESQGNFEKLILLDAGDDPPVLSSVVGQPWVEHARRFSDCIYAHLFDWRYVLAFDSEGRVEDMAYAPEVQVQAPDVLGRLQQQFRESVATRWVIDRRHLEERRFLRDVSEHLTVSFRADERIATIRLSAASLDQVGALEAEIVELFPEQIVAERMHSPHTPKARPSAAVVASGPRMADAASAIVRRARNRRRLGAPR